MSENPVTSVIALLFKWNAWCGSSVLNGDYEYDLRSVLPAALPSPTYFPSCRSSFTDVWSNHFWQHM